MLPNSPEGKVAEKVDEICHVFQDCDFWSGKAVMLQGDTMTAAASSTNSISRCVPVRLSVPVSVEEG